MQAMILAARREESPQAWPSSCHAAQGFRRLFTAMDGYPAGDRTLDPPLHEFLPKREDLMVITPILTYAISRRSGKLRPPTSVSAPR